MEPVPQQRPPIRQGVGWASSHLDYLGWGGWGAVTPQTPFPCKGTPPPPPPSDGAGRYGSVLRLGSQAPRTKGHNKLFFHYHNLHRNLISATQ